MNYIKKLQAENKELKEFKDELLRYLSSSKFSGMNLNDKMVNRNDIIMRIHELENRILEIEYK